MNTKKIAKLTRLVNTFKDYESKIEVSSNTPQFISYLLTMNFFYNSILNAKQLTPEQISQLKEGTADRQDLLYAKHYFSSLLSKVISRMESTIRTIQSGESPADDKQLDSMLSFITQGEDSKVAEPPDTQETTTSTNLYRSYFSQSSLNQIMTYLQSGKTPPVMKRFLTVCFIDLVGFSTLAETVDPMKMIDILNYFFEQVNTTIQKYKGDIDKFIGDAMLVTFESAENAVRSAIEILNKDLDIVNSKLDYMEIPDIQVHIGLNTGWILQGNIGSKHRREISLIGDGVNIAARVQSLSPPNEIWMTANTVSSLGKLKWSMEQIGRRKLKGRVQDVMIYRHVRKIRGDYVVLLYEPDKHLNTLVRKQLKDVGIKNIVPANDLKEFEEKLSTQNLKVIVVGPSVDPSSLKSIVNEAEKQGKKSPLIPIIRKKIDADSLALFEKLGLNVFVPFYKEKAMEKVNNAIINEKVKDIPKIMKEPNPQEVSQMVEQGDVLGKPTDEDIEELREEKLPDTSEPKIKKAQESKVETSTSETIKGDLQRKTGISVTGNEVKVIIKDILNQGEINVLKQDLTNLWQYSLHKQTLDYTFNLLVIKPDLITEELLNPILKILDFNPDPRKLKVKVEFPADKPIPNWESIKGSFKYQFLN